MSQKRYKPNELIKAQDINNHMEALASENTFDPVKTSFRSHGSVFEDVNNRVTVRDQMTRRDYERFRPEERVPTNLTQEDYRETMILCKSAYERVGIVRSVVDLMSEFVAEGIEIVHPDEGPNNFYKAWSKKVNLEDRAERASSWLFKSGNFVARRKMGVLDNGEVRRMKRNLQTMADIPSDIEPGRIPLEYIFYDPATVELVGGNLGSMSENKIYALRIPVHAYTMLQNPKTDLEKEVFDSLPDEVKRSIQRRSDIQGGISLVRIPNDKIFVGHYKKDDTDMWGKSFIYSILSDIFYNDKLKLAKTSALDGWYNAVRLWKLGDHEAGIFPSPAHASKLANILTQNTGGGTMDIIWDSMIAAETFYPPVDKLVNFKENYHSILLGLGVPEQLVGGEATQSAGIGTNTIGLKNLIKRLEAARRVIREWLEEEITIIQKNMGFRRRPFIRFSNEDLHDERTYYNLLIQLLDRNVISDQTVLERIKEIPEIELANIAREEIMRDNGDKPIKAGTFHNPQVQDQREHELEKIKEQSKSKDSPSAPNETRKKGVNEKGKGRPPGSKDTVKRTRRENLTRSPVSSSLSLLEASKLYDSIDEIVTKYFLNANNIKNVRSLTSADRDKLDLIKDRVFISTEPKTTVTINTLTQAHENSEAWNSLYQEFTELCQESLKEIPSDKVTVADKRLIKISSYLELWENRV